MIKAVNADIQCLGEIEDRLILEAFAKYFFKGAGAYSYNMLVGGIRRARDRCGEAALHQAGHADRKSLRRKFQPRFREECLNENWFQTRGVRLQQGDGSWII